MLSDFFDALRALSAPFLSDAFVYTFLQLGIFVTFLITAVRAWRTCPSRLRELFTAFVFGLLLEEGDIIIFGTYTYNPSWFSVGYVPIGIGMTWAMIVASAMNWSDALGLPSVENLPRPRSLPGTLGWLARGSVAPIADAVWAIILDLALDAVAIRLKLWTWTIPLDQGWFGVPWGNFYAWLFVVALFSFFTRLVRRRERERGTAQGWWQLAVPVVAYGALLLSLVPYIALQLTLFNTNREGAWPIFGITLAFFVGVTLYALLKLRSPARENADLWLILLRAVIHLNFLAAIFAAGIFLQLPILLWVALAMLILEFILTWYLHRSASGAFTASRFRLNLGETRAE